MRLLRYLIVSGSAAAMAGAVTLTGVTATTVAAPARVHHAAPSARFLAEARTALVKYFRHNHPQAMLVHARHAHAVKNVKATGSFNWSGYADTATAAQTFTKVSGSWTAPSVSCNAEDQVTSELGRPGRLQQRNGRAARHARLVLPGQAHLHHLVRDVPGWH